MAACGERPLDVDVSLDGPSQAFVEGLPGEAGVCMIKHFRGCVEALRRACVVSMKLFENT